MSITESGISRRQFLGAAAATAAVAGVAGASGKKVAFADEAASGTYTAGTYTATATGIGEVTVTVTFDETSITEVVLDVSNKTETIGQAAADELIEQVLAAQSADIEGVSGATLTSTAVSEGVADCIAQASAGAATEEEETEEEVTEEAAEETTTTSTARWSWEEDPEPIDESEIVETIDVDICVVGAGFAGVCAAQSAAEEGGSVLVLEQSSQANGRGLDIGSINNTWQQENPDISQYIDATEAERIFYEWNHGNCNRMLFRFWANNSGEAFDHLADYLKENYDIEPALSATAIPDRYDADDYLREMPDCQSFGEGWYDDDGNWLMQGVVNKIVTWAEDLGAEFRYDAPAEQLVQDEDGRVTGVIASTADGYIQVNASKGVILATGDIGGNEEMLEAYCPIALRVESNVYTPAGGNNGDALKLGHQVGAAYQHGAAAPVIHPMGTGGPLAQSGDPYAWLDVNIDGFRYNPGIDNTVGMADSMLNQPKAIGYSIFDSDYYNKILQMAPDNTGVDGTAIVDENTQTEIDEAVAANDGLIYMSDTIEGLAEQIGADPDVLQATVDRWNELCELGEDVDMSLASDMLTPLDTPPYYASKVPQAILVIIYGLNCDSYSRVCDENDDPIEGLYAIGNIQGNFFSSDYPMVTPGISHGRGLTFGYKLPKAMLNDELISYDY